MGGTVVVVEDMLKGSILSFLLSFFPSFHFFVFFYFIQTETFWEIETITKRIVSQFFERRLFQDHEEGDMR